MRHLKDIALCIVTVWAALVVARIVAVLILNQRPGMSDDALNVLYLAAVFVTEPPQAVFS